MFIQLSDSAFHLHYSSISASTHLNYARNPRNTHQFPLKLGDTIDRVYRNIHLAVTAWFMMAIWNIAWLQRICKLQSATSFWYFDEGWEKRTLNAEYKILYFGLNPWNDEIFTFTEHIYIFFKSQFLLIHSILLKWCNGQTCLNGHLTRQATHFGWPFS